MNNPLPSAESKSWYQKYRYWSEKHFGGKNYRIKYLFISLSIGLLLRPLLNLVSSNLSVYVLSFLGIIAAVDAWGAARHRGQSRVEASIRAAAILTIVVGMAVFIHFTMEFRADVVH